MLAVLDGNTIKADVLAIKMSNIISTDTEFILKSVRVTYKKENDKITDEIEATYYNVVNPDNLDNFNIKTIGKMPVITQEELEKSPKQIRVKVDKDTIIKPYEVKYGKARVSVIANEITILADKVKKGDV